MNILFVNYGDFTANSLNHIAGFARALEAMGHACAVAVPDGKESLAAVPDPRFLPATYAEMIARPASFPDGRPADIVHAWTPRENVRKFVLAYQRLARARLIVHLEDNEEYLLAAWFGRTPEEVAALSDEELARFKAEAAIHPRRYRFFLGVAEGVTAIVGSLGRFVPPGVPWRLLEPGIAPEGFAPPPADPALRRELGFGGGERIVVFTGSITFANQSEVRDLYDAVALLNRRGFPVRLVRTGLNFPPFQDALPAETKALVRELGFVDKARLRAVVALADVLIQPGRPGAFNDFRLPSKLPEFLASGRPVILPASNLGLELKDGVEALVLRQGGPEEIVDACVRLFSDPELAAALGRNGAAFARKRFDLAANTLGLAECYEETLRRPLRPGSTGAQSGEESEVGLSLRALAAGSAPAVAASLADLAAVVASIERNEEARGERLRLEHERDEWRSQHGLAQQHGKHLDEQLKRSREHAAAIEQKLAATEQHLRNVNRGARALRRQVAEAGVQMDRLDGALRASANTLDDARAEIAQGRDREAGLRATIHAREAKIRAMQESASWKLTQPLRYLRRKWIDPRRRPGAVPAPTPTPAPDPAAPAPTIVYSVDDPQGWTLSPRKILIRGWCFSDDGRRLVAVRAVFPDRTIAAVHGLKRLDVFASVRSKSQAEYCGWQFEVELRPADTRLDMEACDEQGAWHRFFHTALRVGEGLVPPDLTQYQQWIEAYDPEDGFPTVAGGDDYLLDRPLISVIMPVYNTPERWLRRAIESVREQTYPNWELCIADDASTERHVRAILEEAAADPRIKVCYRETNGHISRSSNSALALAKGAYVALLDHDDELASDALYEVAAALDERPDADFLYSDEDKIDEEGRRYRPYFKPDWLPDLFLAQNYASHLSVYRREVVEAVGGFRPGFEGSQDWDLALRVVERITPARIVHIRKVLYHWRSIPGSTALQLSEKNYPVEAARRALAEHFKRTGERAEILPVPGDHWRIRYPLPTEPPLVTLIIPTRNGSEFLRRCVDSILEKTTYPNFEILLVDNGSDEPAALAALASLAAGTHPLLRPRHSVRVVRYEAPFNYSAINNFAVREARGELVALLNNDLEAITPDWLEEMASQALRPEIGCVGAMLYYPNDTIQHAGIILGLGGVAGHAFRDFPRGTEGVFNRARLVQNYSAVTAACLVVRKAVYEQVGGLDEKELAVAFNDVDFCLKVRAAGYRNLWTPFAEFIHHESVSRGVDDTAEKAARFRSEVEAMLRRWGPQLAQDPAYNPNLTLLQTDFSLATPPRPTAVA